MLFKKNSTNELRQTVSLVQKNLRRAVSLRSKKQVNYYGGYIRHIMCTSGKRVMSHEL